MQTKSSMSVLLLHKAKAGKQGLSRRQVSAKTELLEKACPRGPPCFKRGCQQIWIDRAPRDRMQVPPASAAWTFSPSLVRSRRVHVILVTGVTTASIWGACALCPSPSLQATFPCLLCFTVTARRGVVVVAGFLSFPLRLEVPTGAFSAHVKQGRVPQPFVGVPLRT